jgi:hypothetical protein
MRFPNQIFYVFLSSVTREPGRLTTNWASTVFYRDSFTFFTFPDQQILHYMKTINNETSQYALRRFVARRVVVRAVDSEGRLTGQ